MTTLVVELLVDLLCIGLIALYGVDYGRSGEPLKLLIALVLAALTFGKFVVLRLRLRGFE